MAGAKKGSVLAKVGHLIEKGTNPHTITAKKRTMVTRDGIFIGKSATHPGTTTKPWLQPALDDNTGQAVSVFGQFIGQEIVKFVEKGKR